MRARRGMTGMLWMWRNHKPGRKFNFQINGHNFCRIVKTLPLSRCCDSSHELFHNARNFRTSLAPAIQFIPQLYSIFCVVLFCYEYSFSSRFVPCVRRKTVFVCLAHYGWVRWRPEYGGCYRQSARCSAQINLIYFKSSAFVRSHPKYYK